MIKYAVTGHTQGIGKALYDRLSPNCVGFSKSTGTDINKASDRQVIIKEAAECDIFINNATDGFGQTLLLLDLVRAWGDKDKTIINVGSRIAELANPVNTMLNYQAEKLILKEMSVKLKDYGKCRIQYKWFAYVGTARILAKYPHFKYPQDYITEREACDIILG